MEHHLAGAADADDFVNRRLSFAHTAPPLTFEVMPIDLTSASLTRKASRPPISTAPMRNAIIAGHCVMAATSRPISPPKSPAAPNCIPSQSRYLGLTPL